MTPASPYQILMAMVWVLIIFLSSMQGIEAINRWEIIGSLLAVGRIALVVGGTSTANIFQSFIAAIILAALFISEGG